MASSAASSAARLCSSPGVEAPKRSSASGSHDVGHSGAEEESHCSCSAPDRSAPAATAREMPSAPAPGLPVAGGRAIASHAICRPSRPVPAAAASLAPSYVRAPRHTTPPAGKLAATEQMPEYTGAATTTGVGLFHMALARMALTPEEAEGFNTGGVAAAGATLGGGAGGAEAAAIAGAAAAAFAGSGQSAGLGALAAPRGLGSGRLFAGAGRETATGLAQCAQYQEPSGTAGSGGVRQYVCAASSQPSQRMRAASSPVVPQTAHTTAALGAAAAGSAEAGSAALPGAASPSLIGTYKPQGSPQHGPNQSKPSCGAAAGGRSIFALLRVLRPGLGAFKHSWCQ